MNAQQHDHPCCLKFKGDSALTAYSIFYYYDGLNVIQKDSTNGKITKIDSLADGSTAIEVLWALSNQKQTLYIANKTTLIGVSEVVTNATFIPGVSICPPSIKSLTGSTWRGKIMTGGGPTEGMVEYPDVADITFMDKAVSYVRNGKVLVYTPSDKIDPVAISYQQKGALVYFYGYNESVNKIVPYFGVIAPDGKSIFVDSASPDARLPNYLQTINWYGQAGVTPIIYKQN